MQKKSSKIIRSIALPTRSVLLIRGIAFPCAIGRTKFKRDKREGDGATPLHALPLRQVFYRKDRLFRPFSTLSIATIAKNDGWEERISHPRYNQLTKAPHPSSEEYLWRDDDVYDIVIVLGWNDRPIKKGRGSAIFLHLAREGFTPTAGCIAVTLKTMHYLLTVVSRETVINPATRKGRYRP